jgi:hypothetical protein
MLKLDNVQRVMALDAMLVFLEEKLQRAVDVNDVREVGRIHSEVIYCRQERDSVRVLWTEIEERRYEVECEERH